MTDQDAHLNRFSEPEAIDELMDRVADQLESQMRAANKKLRIRAARLLNPSQTSPDGQPPDPDDDVDDADAELDPEV